MRYKSQGEWSIQAPVRLGSLDAMEPRLTGDQSMDID
jgi:hypothetical protein